MGEYIELGGFSSGSSVGSSTETLFSKEDYSRSRVHPGYGASQIPLKLNFGTAIYAGSGYNKLLQGQLGAAASNPDNAFSRAVFGEVKGSAEQYEEDTSNLFAKAGKKTTATFHGSTGTWSRNYKPYNQEWNDVTRALYPEHWNLLNPQVAQQERRDQANLSRGEPQWYGKAPVLPLSRNIGPGNRISPPTNAADSIAAHHDLHYEQAKKDSDVLSADREAISQFIHEAVQSQDPVSRLHATVGAVGLGVKHAVESLTGQVYYGELNGKRTKACRTSSPR